jgi:hypothetical protein
MKRLFYFSVILSFTLVSCQKSPRAYFSTDTSEPEVGQVVYFDNNSRNADNYEWDFGDGYISDAVNPEHVFRASGSFEVSLTAKSNSGYTDKATLTMNVMIPTLLEIEVLEFYHEYPVANASVRLYPTLTDWNDETNMELEGFTDSDGKVVFSGLGAYVWYVDVWAESYDNYLLKNESVDYIRTDEVIPHKINRFIAWVDSVDHGKGALRGDRKLYIKSIERVPAFRPRTFTGSDDWKMLYEKSVSRK